MQLQQVESISHCAESPCRDLRQGYYEITTDKSLVLVQAIRRSLKGDKDPRPHHQSHHHSPHLSLTPKSAIAILPPKKVSFSDPFFFLFLLLFVCFLNSGGNLHGCCCRSWAWRLRLLWPLFPHHTNTHRLSLSLPLYHFLTLPLVSDLPTLYTLLASYRISLFLCFDRFIRFSPLVSFFIYLFFYIDLFFF